MGNIQIEEYEGVTITIDDMSIPIDNVEAQKNLSKIHDQMGTDEHGN